MSKKIYQPKFNQIGQVIGHEDDMDIWSFCVWSSKENLLKDYPKCIVEEYDEGDIEDPTYMDVHSIEVDYDLLQRISIWLEVLEEEIKNGVIKIDNAFKVDLSYDIKELKNYLK